MAKSISDETRAAILKAAWRLIGEKGRVDVSQAEIAAAAGVTRQSIFYAFGNRTGLLTAMARHQDATSARRAHIAAVGAARPVDLAGLLDIVAAWLDYLPEVYPVASLLDAAGLSDPEARAAIDDRLIGELLGGFKRRMAAMAKKGKLPAGTDPDRLAEEIWELTHVRAWRALVVDCGWTPEEFKANRLRVVRVLLNAAGVRE